MSQKTYLNILKGGVFASFLILFFVFDNLLFPFITSKQIPFNILVEVMTIFWLGLIVKFPGLRPKKNWLSFGLIGFLAVLLLTSFTGVDFNLSFWGNIERMLGVFHLFHFLLLYFIIITVFRTKQDWLNLLMVSVFAAFIQCFYVIFSAAFGTFGNTSYVSGYMIFNIFFALILFYRQKNWALRSFYIISILLMLDSMVIAGTRGAIVGLGVSILIFLFAMAAKSKNQKIKYGSFITAGLFVVFVALIFANANSGWVKNNKLFSRITEINSKTTTFQTRLVSWKSAFKDFHNHPILGTGYGNYAITFDKYFDPTFYNYTTTDTYFDHAHNNLIDIASTAGSLGLVAYLLMFVALFYYLIKAFRAGKVNFIEFILLVCLVVAYFIQNVVLFDSFVTYFSLMITFGFIYWLVQGAEEVDYSKAVKKDNEFAVLIIAGLVILTVLYQYSLKPWQMLTGTIAGQYAVGASGDLAAAVDRYREALSINTPLDRDSRKSLAQLVLQRSDLLEKLDKPTAQKILDFSIEQLNKNIQYNPHDSFELMISAQLYNLAANFNGDSQQKFSYYSNLAEAAINNSIDATPGRIPVYFIKAQILISRGQKDQAISILKYASSLNPLYPDAKCQLSKFYFYSNDKINGYKELDNCVDLGGSSSLNTPDQIGGYIDYYLKRKDLTRAIKLLERLTQLEPKEAKIWASLAEIYRQHGDIDLAVSAANQAAENDPTLKDSAAQFIKNLGR